MSATESESQRVGPTRGRPAGGSVLWRAVRRLGKDPDDVRDMVVGKLIAAAEGGEEYALRILSDRILPVGRTLEGLDIFQKCETPEQMSAAVLGAIAAGVLSPVEGNTLNANIQALALTGEWREVRAIQRRLIAGGAVNLPPLPPPQAALPPPVDPFS